MFLFHNPFSNTVSYNRIKFNNFKDTFADLNIEFDSFYNFSDLKKILNSKKVHIIYTSFHNHYLDKIDLNYVKNFDKNIKILMDLPIWENPISSANYTDVKELKNNKKFLDLIDKDTVDFFTCYFDKTDLRMQNFKNDTGKDYFYFSHCANTRRIYYQYDNFYKCDCSFLGSNLPKKRSIYNKIFPYLKNQDFKIHGQGWSKRDNILSFIQKIGEYKNINFLKKINLKKLDLDEERKIYSSTKININIHNEYEHFYGGPINERFYSIAACKGFQISDNLRQISNNFNEGYDVVTWTDRDDFIDKFKFYLKNYDLANDIAKRQHEKIIKKYTYKVVISNLLKYCQ